MWRGAAVPKLQPQAKALPLKGGTNLAEIRAEKWGSRAELQLSALMWGHSLGSGAARAIWCETLPYSLFPSILSAGEYDVLRH